MLTLTRKDDEGVILTDGTNRILVLLHHSTNKNARIGFQAPAHWTIVRQELDVRPDPHARIPVYLEPRDVDVLAGDEEADQASFERIRQAAQKARGKR